LCESEGTFTTRKEDDMPKTWFIAGASRGMARELAEQLLARGDHVAATARDTDQLADLVERYGDQLWVRALDVTDTTDLRAVLDDAFGAHGRVDVVVSNAGYGVFGVAEDLTDEQIDRMIATNLTASVQLARAAVPHLRAQGGGLLMQMSSMGAHIAFPAFSLYHLTKWGIEGFYEALAQEVAPFGIHTTLVEPGVVRTGFFDAATRMPLSGPYVGGPADRPPTRTEEMVDGQENTVAAIIRAGDSAQPPRRLVLGSDAWRLITEALRARLDDVVPQRANAATADIS
jgi:NAD(P)-dependent dehydrogenase (short-subunit alcohol dehydrogenase family)